MGYLTKVKGRITFHPPVSTGFASMDRQLSKFLPRSGQYPDIELAASGRFGLLDTILCPETSSFKAYDLEDNLHELVDALPDRHFTGRLELQGEDGDIYGYRIKDGQVETIEPKLAWPED